MTMADSTNLLIIYSNEKSPVFTKEGEKQYPEGIMRTQDGRDIRVQYFFNLPKIEKNTISELCQRLFFNRNWIVVCPEVLKDQILDIINDYFGSAIRINQLELNESQDIGWNRILNDNINSLTTYKESLKFELFDVVLSIEKNSKDVDSTSNKFYLLFKKIQVFLILALILMGFVYLENRYHTFAIAMGVATAVNYDENLYPVDSRQTLEHILGNRLFEIVNQTFYWSRVNSDSVFSNIENNYRTIGMSLLNPELDYSNKFLWSKPYLRTGLVVIGRARIKQRINIMNVANFKFRVCYVASGRRKSIEDAIKEYQGEVVFISNSIPEFNNLIREDSCDLLILWNGFQNRFKNDNERWTKFTNNYRQLSYNPGSREIDSLLFNVDEKYYSIWIREQANKIENLIGKIGFNNRDSLKLHNIQNNQYIKRIPYKSYKEGIEALMDKKISSFIISAYLFSIYKETMDIENLDVFSDIEKIEYYAIAFNKNRMDLREKFNRALEIAEFNIRTQIETSNRFQNQVNEKNNEVVTWFPIKEEK